MRLIDADELIMDLSDYALQESPNDNMDDEEKDFQSQIYAAIMFCIDFVEQTKTAYDVDKVVEELRRVSGNGYRDIDGDYVPPMIETKNAIEIVKQGGVSDDVCEWKLEDEEVNLYLTGCQKRKLIFEGTPEENGYRYCPYCGKKILEQLKKEN